MGKTSIEWTDYSWNNVTGCGSLGTECDNCYAKPIAERFRGTKQFPNAFDLTLKPERLEEPLHWHKPRRVFVNSMSDTFHKDIPLEFLDRIFNTMERAHWHTFQVLTKRSSLMRDYTLRRYEHTPPPPNVWLGVSVGHAATKSRIRHLQDARAAIRFLSIEPLIGRVGTLDLTDIDWVICGGESGSGHRKMDPDWAREGRDQCVANGVPFFFKQWGGIRPKSGGRTLDGRVWDEYPRQPRNDLFAA